MIDGKDNKIDLVQKNEISRSDFDNFLSHY